MTIDRKKIAVSVNSLDERTVNDNLGTIEGRMNRVLEYAAAHDEDNTFTGENTFTRPNRFTASNVFAGDNTFTGDNTFSGDNSFTGVNAFTGANTHTGAESHTGVETHTGNETHTGAEEFSGNCTFSGDNTFSGSNTFSAANSFTGSNTFTPVQTFNGQITANNGIVMNTGMFSSGSQPRENAFQNVPQAIPSGVATALTFNGSFGGTGAAIWNGATDMVIPAGQGGTWLFLANVTFAGAAAGVRSLYVERNGAATIALVTLPPAGAAPTGLFVMGMDAANPGDIYRAIVVQNTGAPLNTGGGVSTFLCAIRLF